ncbi:cysteine dioxygenase [Paenibacillus koleovorans]|uniref:cysteine dioxygenase n=1 Tax=Paenibacillus koleovorans TaxID=121608 RepID=UPI000FDA8893|nr:cysteine dioxygenase family protein [Paenibacillus koleovorans]
MDALSDCIGAHVISLQHPTCEQLKTKLAELRVFAPHLLQDLPEPEELAYGRRVLYRNEHVEAILVHLPPGGETLLHDHGQSICTAIVLEGRLLNECYEPQADASFTLFASQPIEADGYLVSVPDDFHRMSNPFHDRAVSLHLYAPPLSGVRSYR